MDPTQGPAPSTSTSAPSFSPPLPSPSQPSDAQASSSRVPLSSTSPSTLPHGSTSPSTLPHSPETLRQIAEARAALEASMNNIGTSLSNELKARAQNLHSNSAQLDKQMKDVEKGTQALKKENDKLAKLAKKGQQKMKELGNVQNWAEMLERDFLVLGETLRLVREGSESGSYSGSGNESWSESESDEGGEGERDEESLAGDKRRELIGAGFGVGDEGKGFLDIYGLSEDTTMGGVDAATPRNETVVLGEPEGTAMQDVEDPPRRVDKGKGKEKALDLEQQDQQDQHLTSADVENSLEYVDKSKGKEEITNIEQLGHTDGSAAGNHSERVDKGKGKENAVEVEQHVQYQAGLASFDSGAGADVNHSSDHSAQGTGESST